MDDSTIPTDIVQVTILPEGHSEKTTVSVDSG